MKFAEPSWLIAGLFVIAGLIFLYRVLDKRQRAALAEFASNHLLAKLTASFSPGRRMVKRGLFLAALACIFVALARPQWGFHWVDQKERGIDLIFAIDTSKSMLTQDVNPDRLTRAKMAITDFVRKLDGDRVGLIAFAGEGFLQAPLTLDYDAFQDSLDSIDVNTIPRGGTNIASAIQEAQAAFANNTQNKKILILVTDGEDLDAQGIDAAKAAAKDGLVVYTVGVGTAAGGVIPVANGNGTDFVKDPATGEFVKSHLDENTLTQIADATGGMYQPLGQQGQGLGVIYDKALASLPKHDLAAKRERVYEERYQLPLAAGLVLLVASMLIGTRRRVARREASAVPFRVTKKAAVAAALALAIVPTLAQASPQSAESAYKKGDYNKAETQYQDAAAKHPEDAPLQYDLGASAYKTGEFDTALPAFQKALGTDDPALQQQSYYNIGNTQYRIGQKTAKSAPQDTIKQWQSAVEAYDGALKLKPDDADAKFNRDFVQKKLDELQKQQQQDQKNQQDKNQQDKNQQQQQNQQQQEDQKNQQNQQQQNQQGQNSQQNQDQQQQNQQQTGSKGGQSNQQDQQQQQNGQNQAQNGQQNQNGQQQKNDQQQQQNGQQPQTADNKQGQDKSQNGQQQQTAGNQQKQDQGKDGQQQQQTAGNQPQNQQQNGNNGDQQKQQMAQGKQGGGATGQAAAADKNKQSGDQAADAALPEGELTKEQAKDLLNSLKGEEHILPVAADTRSAKPQDQTVTKDW